MKHRAVTMPKIPGKVKKPSPEERMIKALKKNRVMSQIQLCNEIGYTSTSSYTRCIVNKLEKSGLVELRQCECGKGIMAVWLGR